jgi:predicted metal-dependent hydrolase
MVEPSPPIEVRRSPRRRRTVSAYREGDRIVILMPARTSKAEERQLITEMVDRVTRREARMASGGARAGNSQLQLRARQLSAAYLEGRAQPVSVRWVTNMQQRWGSCTITDRTIRLSHRLQSMPSWVIDYVLMHELSHLLEPGHDRAFWAWVERYPRTERARGFLEGVAVATQLPGLPDCDSPDSSGGSCGPDDGLFELGDDGSASVPVWAGGMVASAAGVPVSVGMPGASACSASGSKPTSSGPSNSGIRRS